MFNKKSSDSSNSESKVVSCITKVNVGATYKDVIEEKVIPAITYQVPKTELVTETYISKEAAVETYFEYDEATKELKECIREIPAQVCTITYEVATGEYDTVVVQPTQTVRKVRQVKSRDGFIAQKTIESKETKSINSEKK